MHTAYA